MKRFRFNIGTLVILVLFFGVGLAALRESNEAWYSSIFTLTLGILLISILLAIHRTEKRRAFWLGFDEGAGLSRLQSARAIGGTVGRHELLTNGAQSGRQEHPRLERD